MFQNKKKSTSAQNIRINKESLAITPLEFIQNFKAFVLEKSEKGVKIAAVNPKDADLQRYAKRIFGNKIEWFNTTENSINSFLKNYKHDLKTEILQLSSTAQEVNENITKIVDGIIKYAFNEKASDIHIEPTRNETRVRFRLDGALHTVLNLPRYIQQALVARFKILANLKIDEYRRPQDGRIEVEEFSNASLRISIMPTLFGEKVALRILDESNKNTTIEDLGFSEAEKDILLENIEKPHGMIIASGPTGSGKTTTLYVLLQLLKKEGINISTLEDPIEYSLEGVNQIQINPRSDLTFPSGLRSLLRQDPDVIMVGEIRDSETAIMASNAALTGHLVFTTLHTNDAASAFVRFLEMKVEDFVVSSTINLVIAQRLVRRICKDCAVEEKLEPAILKKIKERKDIMGALEKRETGLSENIEKLNFKIGKGCKKCFQTGYSGRIGIFELLKPNKEIHDLILSHASVEKIKSAAEKDGFRDIIADGLDKVFKGFTTFNELLRVTKSA